MPAASSHRQIVSKCRSDRHRKGEKERARDEASGHLPLDSPAACYDTDTAVCKRWYSNSTKIARWKAYKDLDAVRPNLPFITLPYDGNGDKGGDDKKGAPGVYTRPASHRHPASAPMSNAAASMTSTRPARQGYIQHAGTLDLIDIPAKLNALAEDWDRKYGSTAMDVRIVPYECGSTERYVTAGPGRSTEKDHQALSAATGLGFARWSNAHHTNTNPGDTTQSRPVQVMMDNLSPAVTIRDVQHVCSDFGRVVSVVPMLCAGPGVRMLVGFELYEGAMAAVRALHCIVADGRQLSVQLVDRPFQV